MEDNTTQGEQVACQRNAATEQGVDTDLSLSERQLRPQTRGKRIWTTWMDSDTTGDFDPAEEARQRRTKRPRTKARTRSRVALGKNDPLESEGGHTEISNQQDLAVLHFRKKKVDFTDLLSHTEAEEQYESVGYKLRRRSKVADSQVCITYDKTNPRDTFIDLTAKPFARGCWACASLVGVNGLPICSLIDDERKWPCEICEMEGIDCQLIVAPIRKRACQMCKARGIACSYSNTRNHSKSCQQCALVKQPCVAGPVKEFIKPRIRYERDRELKPLTKKKRTSNRQVSEDCVECRHKGVKCTFSTDHEGGPCVDCARLNLPCTIIEVLSDSSVQAPKICTSEKASHSIQAGSEPIRRGASPSRHLQQQLDQQQAHHAISPQPPKTTAPQAHQGTGILRKIYTNFSHPIIFNCDQALVPTPCHFCEEPLLPVIGFGQLHVEVIEHADQSGYTETQGGHRASVDNTRLCTICTTDRMAILCCDKHVLRPIAGRGITTAADAAKMRREIWAGQGVERLCHLCTNVAVCECEAEQDDGRGCGLRLCQGCGVSLRERHDGDLQRMLDGGGGRAGDGQSMTLRADVEFLDRRGPLLRLLGGG